MNQRQTVLCLCAIALLCLLLAIGCANPDEKKVEYFEKAAAYEDSGDLKAAIIEYRNAIKIDPQFTEARYQLGLAYLKTQQPGKALRELERAASLDPSNTDALIKTAEMYCLAKQFKKSREKIDRILDVDKNFPAAYALLAQVELAEKNLTAAETAIDRALQLNPENSRFHIIKARVLTAANKMDRAERALKKAVAINPAARYLKNLAAFYSSRNKSGAAEQILEDLIEKNPDKPESYLDLARLYMKTGRQAEAEQSMLTAIDKDPESVEIHTFLANFYRQTNSLEKAEKAYKAAMAKAEDPTNIQSMLADFYFETGQPESAHQQVGAVLTEKAEHPAASLVKAKLLITDQKNKEALAILDRLTKDSPRWGEAHYQKGVAHLNEGDIQLSLNAVNQAIQLSPGNPDARTLLAYHRLLQRDFESARKNAVQALQKAPGNFRAGIILAKSLLYLGEADKALALFEEMESQAPENIEIIYNRALVHLKQDDIRKAMESLETILDLKPDFSPALVAISNILTRQEKAGQAIARVRQQVKKSPGNPDYWALLAHLVDKYTSSPDEALEYLRKAQALAPDSPRIYKMTADLLVRTDKTHEAIEKYRALTQANPDYVEGYIALGTLFEKTGNPAEARQTYKKALEIDPDFAPAANNLAWMMANEPSADLGEALRLAMRAQKNAPGNPYIADTLGWVHYKRGSHKLALAQFTRATQKRPHMPTLRYHLALALHADGQTDKAKEALTDCLNTDENFPERAEAEKLLKKLS